LSVRLCGVILDLSLTRKPGDEGTWRWGRHAWQRCRRDTYVHGIKWKIDKKLRNVEKKRRKA